MIEIRPGVMSDVTDIQEWKAKVLERDGGACVNCELKERVAACFVIPPEAGGKLRVSNGVTICRNCRIAADGARVLPQRIDNKTPINFLMSTRLHQTVTAYAADGSRFGSLSALLRAMISSFIIQPELYEDLQNWQDAGSDVKVNGWVDGAQYEVFKNMCHDRGMSYTDALKALLLVAVEGYSSSSETRN
jgi:hypothetical protein